MWNNKVTNLLQITYPIIQAPMAGGITTSRLVAAVANSGGLGMIGAGYMSPNQLREQIREIKTLTKNSFGVNLFVPTDYKVSKVEVDMGFASLQTFRSELGVVGEIPAISNYGKDLDTFNKQLEVILEENVSVCSFTFGVPSKEIIDELKKHQIVSIGTATTTNEAIQNESAGMDLITVQGSEAGGHRGTFADENRDQVIGLMSLIPQVVDKVSIPVVAAGGIMDGRGLMASLCLGAGAVQMGTVFLTCVESGAHPIYKKAILHANEDETVMTRAFSGKWARGIKNQFISEMESYQDQILPFPVQNTLTSAIRKASAAQENPEFMSLWTGQTLTLAKNQTVEELINHTINEATEIRNKQNILR
ncbi:nitronate monooxygenase [Cytobacillus sp. S13-E01]|uniref:NAD(P)H-dependent flavin oxidoreductase n=1 Tax=Cytobacillus sp. S13-E01 TaxID=3031326 RepID=UPI0023D8B76A|nr:nitronate monooxygenase [Cytobacillus sp. S13-E01]MDF0726009.1 nitronate monooxygenase [Cytobacillus sp. S13-E01]